MAQSLSAFIKTYRPTPSASAPSSTSGTSGVSDSRGNLNVFVIHTPALASRQQNLQNTLGILQKVAQQVGYTMRAILMQRPDINDLKAREADLMKRVQYSASGDAEFDRTQGQLTMPHLSNLLKHMDALQAIVSTAKSPSTLPGDLSLVLEDDAIIMEEFISAITGFLSNPRKEQWDILFTGIALANSEASAEIGFQSTREAMKLIPSKESYFVQPTVAEAILKSLSEAWRFTYRGALSWFVHGHPGVRSMVLTRRLFIDGSKLGVFPSSVNENNVCLFNMDFMELYKMLAGQKELTLEAAEQHFSNIQHLGGSDILHVYGLLLFRLGKKTRAREVLNKAVDAHRDRQGCFGVRSDLLNNLINMESEDAKSETWPGKSKFTDYVF